MNEKKTEKKQDQIRGSMIGGAIGDALGYPVEFLSEREISYTYGPSGITDYVLRRGKALISDDTQMLLFTANGMLVAETRESMSGSGRRLSGYVLDAYQDWMKTQYSDFDTVRSMRGILRKVVFPGCWMCRNYMHGERRGIHAFLP